MRTGEVYRFDRWGEPLGVLADVRRQVRREEVNGEDSMEVECGDALEKGDLLAVCDRSGRWREYRVVSTTLMRDSGVPSVSAECDASWMALAGDYIVDRRPGVQSPATARECLEAALEGTLWEAGSVDVQESGGVSMYHTNALAAVRAVAEEFSAEVRATVEVSGDRVSARRIDLLSRLGEDRTGLKRFEYRKDLADVEREVDASEVVTAAYAWGKGGTDGSHKIGIADVNGGVAYVADEDARLLWGRPDGKGGKAHVFGVYEDGQQEDPSALKAAAEAWLSENSRPRVSYRLKVCDLSAYGLDWEGVALGDTVDAIDDELGVEVAARVTRIEWDDLDPTATEVTLGSVSERVEDIVAGSSQAWGSISGSVGAWDSAANADAAYLDQVREGINAAFEAAGSYVYQSTEHGIVCSTVPLDAEMRPTSTPASAVQIARGIMRISDEVGSDGAFSWTTYATGAGLVADTINAGVLRCGVNYIDLSTGTVYFANGTISASTLKAGRIQDAAGRNYWDLGTGELSMMGYAKVDQAVSGVAVEYALGDSPTQAPESGWSQASPQWTAGKYVWQRTKVTGANGTVTYSNTACIQGAKGDKGDPGEDGAPGLPGADGTDGASSYVHIKYAPVASPSDSQMTEEPGEYIGICTTDSPTAPTSASDYAWSKLEGHDGEDGLPGKDGTDGADGRTTYVHFAYATSPDGTQGFSTAPFEGASYIGVRTDYEEGDPQSPSAYAWSLFKGRDGTDGADGKDGTSVTILGSYGSEAELEQAHPTGSPGDSYIVAGDLYVWDGSGWHNVGTIQGPAGADGQDGAPGKDGLTAYVHRAWANSPDGTQGFSASYFDGAAYMGVYSDHAEADSEDPSDYEWSRFLGQDGAPGTDGTDGVGVSAVVPEWYLSTSKTAPAGGSWSTQEPEWQRGRWIWTRTRVTWTDGTTSYTDPVLAAATNGANEAVDSLDQSLDAQGVFDRLTDHGAIQGIVMEDGSLFVNATYVRTGILSDALGLNSWNLATGELSITGARAWYATCATAADTKAKAAAVDGEGFALTDGVIVMVRWSNGNSAEGPTLDVGGTGAYPVKIYGSELQGDTVYDWAGGSTSLLYWHDGAWNVCDNASLYRNNSAVREIRGLDTSLDQQGVFDRLTNDGTAKGIYLAGGELYINADYIKAGTIVAEILRGASGLAELSPTNLAGGTIIALEMSAKGDKQSSELAPAWGVIPTYATGDSGALHGFATVSRRRVVDFLVDGPGGRRAIGYDGVEIDPDDPVTVDVGYPRVYLSDGYAGLQAEADRMMYVSDSGVWAYDSAKSRGVYATDSAARLARSSQDYVQAQADGIYLTCGGVPAVILPTSWEAFSIRVGGLTFQANTGGMSLVYNSHGFSIEMDGSIHSW